MKSWVSDRRLVAGIFSFVLICLSSAALANVGRTAGTYAVSPTGAATYSIPIWAPRGPNGLQPNISLIYNSQQAAGYVGVGWAVARYCRQHDDVLLQNSYGCGGSGDHLLDANKLRRDDL